LAVIVCPGFITDGLYSDAADGRWWCGWCAKRGRGAIDRAFDEAVASNGWLIFYSHDVEPEPSGWEGLADVRILQAILQSARFSRAVAVDAIPRPRRPDLGQQLQYPSHDDAVLVDVASSTR